MGRQRGGEVVVVVVVVVVVGRGEWIWWTKKRHRMFGVGAGHTESYFTLTLFHITEFFLSFHIMSLFFLRVF